MDLNYLLQTLLRKKWTVFFCTLIALIAGFAFTFFLPKKYVSLAQYSTGFTMEQKVKITEEASFNIYEIDMRFNNVIETFRSAKVMAMLSYNLLLHDLESPTPFRTLDEDIRNSAEFKIINLEQAKQILRRKIVEMEMLNPYNPEEQKVFELIGMYGYNQEKLSTGLNFARVEHSDFINIFFRSENPELSAFVVNTIGDQFIRFFNNIYGSRNIESAVKLDSLLQEQKMVVDSLTNKLKDFRDRIGTPNIGDRASAAMVMVQDLNAAYQSEQTRLNELRASLRTVESQLKVLRETSGGDVGTNNNATILLLERDNQNLELSKRGKSTEEIAEIDQKINDNIRRLDQLRKSSGTTANRERQRERTSIKLEDLEAEKINLENRIAAANDNVRQIESQKSYYERITTTGGGDEVLLKSRQDELRLATQEYEQLKKSMQSSLDLDVNPVNNFKQTLVGLPAYKPEPSKKVMLLGMSGFLGFFLSVFAVLAVEFLDGSYKTPSMFRRSSQLTQVGVINKVNLNNHSLGNYFKESLSNDHGREGNLFIENLRKIRFEVERSGKKVVLFTSTRVGEGKTFIITALANAFHVAGKKVLIIDANLSNNQLTNLFEAKPTLNQIDMGKAGTNERLWTYVTNTALENVHIIGCPAADATPEELLPVHNIFNHMKDVAGKYDYILIEGAALNLYADSRELSMHVDGIVNVVAAQSSAAISDKESFRFLEGQGDKFLGAILNRVDERNLDL